jgi:hypothetical protein
MKVRERNEHQTICPRCAGEAEWSFLNPEMAKVEIMCSDCGRFEMPREDFDRVAVESAGLEEDE